MKMMMSRKALEEYGLVNLGTINWNLSPPVLVEHALARKEAMLASNGVLAATTGETLPPVLTPPIVGPFK